MNRLWLPLCAVLVMAHLAFGQPSPPPPTPVPIRAQAFIPLEQPPWADWLGHPAMAFTNLNTIPSWDYLETCLSIDTNVPAYLQEPVYESGRTNVTFATGSISVWFQPNWTSVIDGGSGPTNWATLLSIGHWTSNAAQSAWTIALSPTGTNLVMEAQSEGSNLVVFDVPIDFDAGDWHSLTISYTPTNCALYLEGEPVTNTAPIDNYPSESDCAEYGLFVGSMSADGFAQCHGQLQWLTTYATVLTAAQVAANYAEVSEYIAFFGGSLPSGGFHPDTSPPGPGGGFGTNGGSGGGGPSIVPFTTPAAISATNYSAFNEFYPTITNDSSNAYISICNTLSNLTYLVLTNYNLADTNWGLWQTILATNAITPVASVSLTSNGSLFFRAALVWSTCTNYSPALPDWWDELYFNSISCVDPNANPSGDGIDNWDKYILGLNPNISYVSQLVISPPGGNYITMPAVTLLSLNGATIKYTTNGTIPSATNGISIASGVSMTNLPSTNFTLKAWESGSVSNLLATATYNLIPATPTFSLPSGLYASGTTLQITCATPGAASYYTTNGTDPTTNSAVVTTNGVVLTTNVTVKAAAWLGTNGSPIAAAGYIVESAVPPPNDDLTNAVLLSGAYGTFVGTTLASTMESFESNDYDRNFDQANIVGNSVWYQWTAPSNGIVFLDYENNYVHPYYPTMSVYCFPSNIVSDPTNLVPVSSGYDSDYTSETFGVTNGVTYYWSVSTHDGTGPFDLSWRYIGPTEPPFFSPGAGTYTNTVLVSVSDNDPRSTIRYTLDGTSPTTNSTAIVSSAQLLINTNETLKAAAWRPGLDQSTLTVATYTINPSSTNPTATASAPAISPTNEDFASSLTVTLTCTNAGGVVYYTLDGSEPTTASGSISSGGTLTISNSAIVNAVTWVTNMNLSLVTTAQYAKDGVDTAGDGIPDTGKLAIGVDILLPEAGNVNPNPFAHGLNNMQVYQNQSVLLADNYSTENDGIPDWWLVQNGFSATTSANALGANGQTLLTSYLAGLSPNNPNSQPGQTPPIDFHMAHGPSNSMIMELDTVRPGMASYFLTCVNTDAGLPGVVEEFPATQSLDQPGQSFGRYFQLTNQLSPGMWLFTLQGVNSNRLWSTTSSNTFGRYQGSYSLYGPVSQAESVGNWTQYAGVSVPVVGYTNSNDIKESILAQLLRAESDTWVDSAGNDSGGSVLASPVLFDTAVHSLTTQSAWGTLTFQYDPNPYYPSYSPIDFASYFTSICATPDVATDCGNFFTNLDYSGSYSFPDTELAPLQSKADDSGTQYFVMPTNTFNPAGLAYLSVTYRIGTEAPVTLYPGQSNAVPSTDFTFEVALDVETPAFQATGYCFDGRAYPLSEEAGWEYESQPPATYSLCYPLPANDWLNLVYEYAFPIAVTNPVIIAQVGKPVNLQAWSQVVAVTNGTEITNLVYCIDQDFSQAYLCNPTNGDVPRTLETNYNGKYKIDTNSAIRTGILSPNLDYPQNYNNFINGWRSADFTPTQPGKVIVTTLPDDNGDYGEVTIYVIDIQVDANHDGVMDNRDLTSVDNPMQFWVNNNYDRNVEDPEDSVYYDDDVASNNPAADSPGTPGVPTPDCNYLAGDGKTPAIPNIRDLEDYTRLWIPGLSNMLANLPTNYGVNLQWRNNSGAALRLFKAAETNGGTNYLFDEAEGELQLLFDSYPCYGYVSPTQTISLDQAFASTTVPTPSDYFIFCGSAAGNDELVLQVTNQYGGEVGEASVFLNLKDIKQMYERWSVGEDPAAAPSNIATNAGDDGSMSFKYPYDPTLNPGTPYILFVHGWNMETWAKDRFTETAFKRLYWQGYQGRIGSLRWPTDNGFVKDISDLSANTALTDPHNYDHGEYRAWESATGLLNKLIALNIQYPGNVYLLSHSTGSAVCGEALRLATNQLVNTYVASQGEVAAHMYDATVTSPYLIDFNHTTVYFGIGQPNISYGPSTPNIYGNRLASNSAAVGQRISFYNTNDYALSPDVWCFDQELKPDFTPGGYYTYIGSTNDASPWNHFEFDSTTGDGDIITYDIVTNMDDLYKVYAFAAEARSLALGAMAVKTFAADVDLTQVWQNDPSGHSFSDHFWHSAEFRGDFWQEAGYWDALLGVDGFSLK